MLLIILSSLFELLPKQLFGIHPNLGRLPLWQLQEGRQKVGGELFGSFTREEGGEVVDGDDGTSLADALGVDFDGGGGEGGVDRVDGDGVVRVGRAANGVSLRSGFRKGQGGKGKRRETHSQETSTTTLNRRSGPASAMNSEVINLGIGLER